MASKITHVLGAYIFCVLFNLPMSFVSYIFSCMSYSITINLIDISFNGTLNTTMTTNLNKFRDFYNYYVSPFNAAVVFIPVVITGIVAIVITIICVKQCCLSECDATSVCTESNTTSQGTFNEGNMKISIAIFPLFCIVYAPCYTVGYVNFNNLLLQDFNQQLWYQNMTSLKYNYCVGMGVSYGGIVVDILTILLFIFCFGKKYNTSIIPFKHKA